MDKLKPITERRKIPRLDKHGYRNKGRDATRRASIYNPENVNLEWKDFKLGLYLLERYKLKEDNLGV